MGKRQFYSTVASKLWNKVDTLMSEWVQNERDDLIRSRWSQKPPRARFLSPEEEVRELLKSANQLEDIWQFFLKRLRNGSELEFLCFSVLEERNESIRLKFIHPQSTENPFEETTLSLHDKKNHLIQAYTRKDTTFSPHLQDLGPTILPYLGENPETLPAWNLFSVPFIAGNRAVAMLTLGCSEIDTFSQTKLSYVYTVRDQMAQLVWNLILQEQMKTQAQVDNLTGLLSHSYFQRVLQQELTRAAQKQSPLTVMFLDINNLHEINHRLGHRVGDEAIQHLAATVRRVIRGMDTVARYGADEVALLLPETDGPHAQTMAQHILEELARHCPASLKQLSVSAGYATYPTHTTGAEAVLKLAEQALQFAKYRANQTGQSASMSSQDVQGLNETTMLEVMTSQIAKKYDTTGPSVFQELIRRIETKEEGLAEEERPTTSPEHLMLETIGSLAGALEAKDRYTCGHSQAVANYAVALAHALQMSTDEIEQVRLAAFLHDIGKIGIPESILCKPGPLNEKEWEIMKQHPVIGARQILAPVSALKEIIPLVEHHHENWDGTGHPMGLQGEAIPLGARIVSIVDAFHALTSDRAYRKALSLGDAKRILQEGAGTKWDPSLIGHFVGILEEATPLLNAP